MATTIKLTPREIALAKGEPLPEETENSVGDDVVNDRDSVLGDEVFGADDEEPPEYDDPDDYAADDEPDEDEPEGEWYESDAAKSYAESYGLSSDDLSEFKSQDELERFGRMMDRRLASGNEPMTSQIPGFQQHQQPAPRPQEKAPESKDTQSPDAQDELDQPFDIEKLKQENYDENLIRIARIHNRNIERQQQEQQQAQERAHHDALVSFHKTLDSLDESQFGKVFGDQGSRAKQISQVHQMNRDSVFQTMNRMYQSLAAQGQSDIPIEHIARRAAGIVMGDLGTPETKVKDTVSTRTEAARRQSRKRRPKSAGSRTGGSAAPGPMGGSDEVADIANDPRMARFWEKTQRANGTL